MPLHRGDATTSFGELGRRQTLAGRGHPCAIDGTRRGRSRQGNSRPAEPAVFVLRALGAGPVGDDLGLTRALRFRTVRITRQTSTRAFRFRHRRRRRQRTRREPRGSPENVAICEVPLHARTYRKRRRLPAALPNAPMFFTFPDDARWNAERQAVECGVEIGEYHGAVWVPWRVFQRPLPNIPSPNAAFKRTTCSEHALREPPSGSCGGVS